jgi:hypothetical protein
MIDSIGSSTNLPATLRTQASLPASRLSDTSVLTAVQQTQQKTSNAVVPVKVFAVPQTSRNGSSATSRLPRGSLVDILA